MKKILVLAYVWPEPQSSAAGTRLYELLRMFRAQGWQVLLASAASLSPHRADVSGLGITELCIELNSDSFDQVVQEFQPDIVLFDRYLTEEQFAWRVEQVCPHALRVLDTSDLHSLRLWREQRFKQAQQACTTTSQRLAVAPLSEHEEYLDFAKTEVCLREVAAIYRCDLTLLVSTAEMEILQNKLGLPSSLLLVSNLILKNQILDFPEYAQRCDFISIGNFRHPPNWDAVQWLRHELWPLIRARLPQAQLHVYGAYPPPKAMQLHAPQQGFLVQGWADDAYRVMQSARVCLAPLRFGAGIKGKLADAMVSGTPSVTTWIGAEGMHGDLAWPGQIANDAQSFADAAVRLYQDEAAWLQAQQQGRTILQEQFSYERTQAQLFQRLEQVQAQLDLHRAQNLVGAMLRHHSHKSTQYMSQWIAEKNRPKMS
jgi:glycosyltransferase involved in cell wall biosynthesis